MKRTADTKTILKALIDADIKQADIARALGTNRMIVSRCIHGCTQWNKGGKQGGGSQRIYEHIAKVLNLPIDDIFPPCQTDTSAQQSPQALL
jgi:hypothetical protein